MSRNKQTLERFYAAFAELDARTMGECYAPAARFQDEIFYLRGQNEAAGMWGMLCDAARATQKNREAWQLQTKRIEADEYSGLVEWQVRYRFNSTGRLVTNQVTAKFEFNEDRLIVRHRDAFNFWHWSRQALGVSGLLLGWSPYLRREVSKIAMGNLKRYMEGKAGRR